jgi:nucleoside-diphosphate-sugar epimerase
MVPTLLEAGHRVRVLDSLRKGGAGLLPLFVNPRLEFIRGDVRDEGTVKSALEAADAIIHLAAIVGFPACQRDPWAARQINVDATILLDRLRSRDQLVVFPSSVSNYGHVPDGVCTEETQPVPLTLYATTKLEGEKAFLKSGNAIIFRPATAFGLSPQMRLDLLFNEFVFRALSEGRLVVYQPHFMRTFVHVRDFARAFLFALEHREAMRDRIFNLGDESLNLTKGDLALRIQKSVPCQVEFAEVGEDPDRRNYFVEFSRLKVAGFKAQVSVEQGIEELARGLPVLDLPNPWSNAASP